MACSVWQTSHSTDDLQQEIELLDKAQHALLDINNQCQSFRELLDSEVADIAKWITTACRCSYCEGKAACRQLVTDLLGRGQLLKAVVGILRRLLSAVTSPQMRDFSCYQCTNDVCNALVSIIMVYLTSHPSITVKLSLAKQLQQAELLDYLGTAMEQLATASEYCSEAEEDPPPAVIWDVSVHLLHTTVYISWLWPGGFHKSIKARQLAPAAAKLAAALAQLSGQLCIEDPSDITWKLLMPAAVRAAHMLLDLHATAAQNTAVAQAAPDTPDLVKLPAFRQLLMLLLTVQAQLWLECSGESHMQHPPQAVQRLWIALGYMPEQLTTTAAFLKDSLEQADMLSGEKAVPSMFKVSTLIRVLGDCFERPANSDMQSTSADGSLSPQQLRQESQQVLLVMRMAKYLFLHGPKGLQGDIDLLVATVHCFQSYFVAATAVYDNMAERGESPSAVFPIDQILRLLLQYLQYSKDAVHQQQHRQPATADTGSGNKQDPAKFYHHLQQVVLSVMQRFILFTPKHKTDVSLQQSWLVWGQYIAQLKDQMLRNAVRAAADDVEVLSSLYNVIGPCTDTWLRMMVAFDTTGLQQGSQSCYGQLGSNSSSEVGQPERRETAAAAAAATDVSSPDSQASTSRCHQAGPDQAACSPDSQASAVRHDQAGPSPLDLQLLSLMTSFCKGLMQTVTLDDGPSALVIRTQLFCDCLASTAAKALHQRAQQVQPPLQHPVVCPWLSLVGRCMVMMGQRLKHIEQEYWKNVVYMSVEKSLQEKLQLEPAAAAQLHDAEVAQQQLVQQLQAAVGRCSDETDNIRRQLADAKAQKGKQQLFRSLQPQLQKHIAKWRSAEKALDSAMQKLRSMQRGQLEVQQLAKKLKARLQLCIYAHNKVHHQLAAEVKDSVASLLCVARVLSGCLLIDDQQQQQQAASTSSETSSPAASSAALATAKHQLRHDLLPSLVVLDGLCDLALIGDLAERNVVNDKAGLSAADIWAQQYDRVQQDESLQWLQELYLEEQLQSALQAAELAASHLVTAIRGGIGLEHPDVPNLPVPVTPFYALLSSEPYQQLHKHLVAVGSELVTALPHCWCCNNPGCDNLSADSELQLISGKQRICAGCTGGSTDKDINSTAARYCSVQCQKQHWTEHKKVCRRLHRQWKQQEQ